MAINPTGNVYTTKTNCCRLVDEGGNCFSNHDGVPKLVSQYRTGLLLSKHIPHNIRPTISECPKCDGIVTVSSLPRNRGIAHQPSFIKLPDTTYLEACVHCTWTGKTLGIR